MERTDALRALHTKWRYVAAGLLLGLAVAAFLNWSAERAYASTTRLFVDVAPAASEARDPNGAQQFSQQRVVSYVQVLTGRELAQGVVDDLGLPVTAAELTEMITATTLPDTVILEVTVTDSSPERAQAIGAALVQRFISRVAELETRGGSSSPTVEVTVMEPPTFEPSPVSPAVERTLALGAALGLLLGFAAALLGVRMDRSLRSEEDAVAAGGTRLLGRVPANSRLTRRHVVDGAAGPPAVVEAFRTIRVNVQHLDADEPARVVVVSGAVPGEGATTVAINLAVSLARSGSRVLLIDADVRRPQVIRRLGLSSGPGLSDVLAGSAELPEVTRTWGEGTLAVLDAGPLPDDPADQLGSTAMRSLLEQARDQYDYVIVDAPPLLSVVDGAVLSALASGCLVVARLGRTTEDQLSEAVSTVRRVHAHVHGLVLNRMPAATSPGRPRTYTADADRLRPRQEAAATPLLPRHATRGRAGRGTVPRTPSQPDAPRLTGALLPPASPADGRPVTAGSMSSGAGASPSAAT